MNAVICDKLPENVNDALAEINAYSVKNAVPKVSRRQAEIFPAIGQKKYSVTLIDYGAKQNIIRSLCSRGCRGYGGPLFIPLPRVFSPLLPTA